MAEIDLVSLKDCFEYFEAKRKEETQYYYWVPSFWLARKRL